LGPFEEKLHVAQHDWKTANPSKVKIIHNLATLTYAAYQPYFTVKNITAGSAKPGIWPFSRLAFSGEDFEPSSGTPMEKILPNQEIPFPSPSTPLA
jgi:hypothetical protein